MDALRAFKERVDPRDVMNPGKLIYRELPVKPFTFSFNRLIHDIHESGLPDKDKLISLLSAVQICTRCGKCKQVCPMAFPERSMQYHPRNKNMVLGMLLEAVYYSQVNKGAIDRRLLSSLKEIVEHCTSCGRCMSSCPISIPSGEVALSLRALLQREGAGGHPVKERVLEWVCRDVSKRAPKAAKLVSVGQKMQNRFLGFVPDVWKKRMRNPLFSGQGPKVGYTNLQESLKINRGSLFAPSDIRPGMPCALYFPGCGGSLFFDRIGLSCLMLLIKAGFVVAVPPSHLCCGYPLLAAGMGTDFDDNLAQNRQYLASMLRSLARKDLDCKYLVSACGTCQDSLARLDLQSGFPTLEQKDVAQLVLPLLGKNSLRHIPEKGSKIVLHASCHCEWPGLHKIKGRKIMADAIADFTGTKVELSPGCCAESGMGAMTSPEIFNILRQRKQKYLAENLVGGYIEPVLVGCPSCKIGVGRCLINMGRANQPVLHTVEWLAKLMDGEDKRQSFRKKVAETKGGVRIISFDTTDA
jgi:Fe-S oxidoreductase